MPLIRLAASNFSGSRGYAKRHQFFENFEASGNVSRESIRCIRFEELIKRRFEELI
jgi:hypothetical protein